MNFYKVKTWYTIDCGKTITTDIDIICARDLGEACKIVYNNCFDTIEQLLIIPITYENDDVCPLSDIEATDFIK